MLGTFTSKDPGIREIIVPDTAIASEAERYALVMAVIDFVNRMQSQGQYRRWELPEEAMQIYHADYYYAQVCNGGHSQFIGNSRLNPFTLADAEAGLKAMNAGVFLDCFQKMRIWVGANAEEAGQQNGFENRSEVLEELDNVFFEADRDKEKDFYSYARPWVRSLKCLKIVPQDQYQVEIDKLTSLNPMGAQRADDTLVSSLNSSLTNRLQMGLLIAGRRADPPLQIGGLTAGSYETIDDKQVIVWGVRTDQGIRFGVEMDHAVLLLEEKTVEVETESGPQQQRRKDLIIGASIDDVDRAIDHVLRHDIAVGAVAALRQKGYSTGPDWIAYLGPVGEDSSQDMAGYTIGIDAETEVQMVGGEIGVILMDQGNQQNNLRLTPDAIATAKRAMKERLDSDMEILSSIAPGGSVRATAPQPDQDVEAKASETAAPAAPEPREERSLSQSDESETGWLEHHSEEELHLIDQDIRDLHFRLEDPLDAGVSLALMAQDPPAVLLEVGEPIEEWEINDEVVDRVEVMTSVGAMTASEFSAGVSLHTAEGSQPRKTMMGATRRDAIDAAVGASHRYPVALGLFILLEQAGLADVFQGVAHFQTGGAGLPEILLQNPKIQDALAEPLLEAMHSKPGRRKKKKNKSPSEHFVILFEGVPGMALAHFGEQRAVLMPFTGETDSLFKTVPVIPMEELLQEEEVFVARLQS